MFLRFQHHRAQLPYFPITDVKTLWVACPFKCAQCLFSRGEKEMQVYSVGLRVCDCTSTRLRLVIEPAGVRWEAFVISVCGTDLGETWFYQKDLALICRPQTLIGVAWQPPAALEFFGVFSLLLSYDHQYLIFFSFCKNPRNAYTRFYACAQQPCLSSLVLCKWSVNSKLAPSLYFCHEHTDDRQISHLYGILIIISWLMWLCFSKFTHWSFTIPPAKLKSRRRTLLINILLTFWQ